ncbi:hypothetical protein BLNAU_2855 [Blattamonas nauphoetae]|uniref:4Fe-4S ferredoxin-type domain-containing protein n=1 Tax=Blattamonas nauphoetae TaxID=2049346 RepID=A0ABQ9YEW0_9EUKA|nr:hypothetical protein BLNAU_2855 [Blattamonas nauphoetae]
MKATILYFSNTGNTKSVALTIKKELEDNGHLVFLHDGLAIIKQMLQSRDCSDPSLLSKYHDSLIESDIVGLGAYHAMGSLPSLAPRLLSEENSPSEKFVTMKFYFSFSSYGNIPGIISSHLATILHNKNPTAQFLGSVSFRGPENGVPSQAPRGTVDAVRESELKKVADFAKSLTARLNGASLPSMHPLKPTTWLSTNQKPNHNLGPISINADLCISCFKCVSVCPYNALSQPEPGDPVKIPKWEMDDCFGCGRCFNYCPARAIEFPKVKSEKREQYHWNMKKDNLKVNPPQHSGQVIVRSMDSYGWTRPFILASVVFVGFVIWRMI